MDKERIQQLVDDALRPSGAWYAIAPDTWAQACKTLLAEAQQLRQELLDTQEELMREQMEADELRERITNQAAELDRLRSLLTDGV